MNKSLQDIIDYYKNGLLETRNLQISNEKFLTEVICDERLRSSSFKNLSLINLNFTNIDFGSSFFKDTCAIHSYERFCLVYLKF